MRISDWSSDVCSSDLWDGSESHAVGWLPGCINHIRSSGTSGPLHLRTQSHAGTGRRRRPLAAFRSRSRPSTSRCGGRGNPARTTLLRALSRKAFYDPPSEAHRNTADILDGARGIAGRAYGIVDVALIPSPTRNAEEPRVHIAASTKRPA